MALEQVQSIWTRCSAVGLNSLSRSVHMMGSECTTAVTVRMQESSAMLHVHMAISGSRMGKLLLRVESRYVSTTSGALCVMTSGILLMLMWPADNLGSLPQEQYHFQEHSLVRALDPFTYSMRNALAMKIVFRTVSQMRLTFETVATPKMLVSDV